MLEDCFGHFVECHPVIERWLGIMIAREIWPNIVRCQNICKTSDDQFRVLYILMVSCQTGPTHHAYAWQIGPFWQDTLDYETGLWTVNSLTPERCGCNGYNGRHFTDISQKTPDSKVHGANMGHIWGRQDPGGPHVGPMIFVVWDIQMYFIASKILEYSFFFNFTEVYAIWQ